MLCFPLQIINITLFKSNMAGLVKRLGCSAKLDVVMYIFKVEIICWFCLPLLVQAPIRLTTLGCSPTVTIIWSSFIRSLLSRSVAFTVIKKIKIWLIYYTSVVSNRGITQPRRARPMSALIRNALQTRGNWKRGFTFSCGKRLEWKRRIKCRGDLSSLCSNHWLPLFSYQKILLLVCLSMTSLG